MPGGAALLLPVLARKHEDRRPWLWLTLVLQAAGFAALAWRPDAAPIAWAMLLGSGTGRLLRPVADRGAGPSAGSPARRRAVFLCAGRRLPDRGGAALDRGGVARGHRGFRDGWLLHLACVAVVAALYLRAAPSSYARAMAAPRRRGAGRLRRFLRSSPAARASRRDASCTGHMPGLCCGSTGASVLAVSIDGYVRLFLPWLTFEARARFLTRCLLLVAALAARGQAAPAGTRRACTSSTSRRCRWPSAAALHRQHRTFRAVRQRAGRGQALARVAGITRRNRRCG